MIIHIGPTAGAFIFLGAFAVSVGVVIAAHRQERRHGPPPVRPMRRSHFDRVKQFLPESAREFADPARETLYVPEWLYDGLPGDQITDNERES